MKRQALALLALIAAANPALAAGPAEKPVSPAIEREEQLDALFGRLRGGNETEAAALEAKIWEVWSRPVSATAEVLLQEASSAMANREFDAARTVLDELVGSYPAFSEGWNRRATLLFAMEKYDNSLRDIEKVLDLEPRHFGALAGRGMIYQRQQKWPQALDAYRQALRINPGMQGVKDAIKEIEKTEREI